VTAVAWHGCTDCTTGLGPHDLMIHATNGDRVVGYIGAAHGNNILISDNGPPFYAG
jgi:hypothetical protein